ncbi:hypothetical protein OQZ33_06950 [Pedobacter sp. MC2016-05]|uniref:hypothetical protein n=1 Tax=Pedobacter sp. MC2016-05 TaxID=2994474 RepID=UPI0022466E9C|nr:hypothetical protein [Pedobacter sp. MC2016-05]MCX2474062.1 hypothetical protein [Pedobacter sp. MC2016-05]
MKPNYLVGNIFENDYLSRNSEELIQQLDRLKIENNLLKGLQIGLMQKQMNDLHTIAMSSTVIKNKEPKTKKPSKKERLNGILAKRALDSAIKNN